MGLYQYLSALMVGMSFHYRSLTSVPSRFGSACFNEADSKRVSMVLIKSMFSLLTAVIRQPDTHYDAIQLAI